MYLGSKGICRYCGCRDLAFFRELAHTFPEALGNKWVFSLDECDSCNRRFSIYETALGASISPFLTLGGVKGKHNQIRQTGRSKGRSVIARRQQNDRPKISMVVNDAELKDHVLIDPINGRMNLVTPVAAVPFKPRHAYKALVKMGIALLPNMELANYARLRGWLLDVNDNEDFAYLDVAMSFASIANSPALAAGTLLRRINAKDPIPHILFIFSAGSICLQIELMSDHMEDHLPPLPMGTINIKWTNVVADELGQNAIRFEYGDPVHLNWRSPKTEPQPIESIALDFDPATREGKFTPIFRK